MRTEELEILKNANDEVFEPDFELTEEMEACACLCATASGSGSGGGGGPALQLLS